MSISIDGKTGRTGRAQVSHGEIANLVGNGHWSKNEEDLDRMRTILAEGQRLAHVGSFEGVPETGRTIWSDEEHRIYGLDPSGPSPSWEELLAKHIHPDDVELLEQSLRAAMESGGIFELEHRIVRPDGSVRVVHNRAHPHFDKNGKLVSYVGATLDITDRKLAEDQLLVSIDRMEEGFFACDKDWRFVQYNAMSEKFLGVSRAEALGRSHWEVFPVVLGTPLEGEYRRTFAGEVRDFEHYCNILKRWFHNSCYPRAGGGISVHFRDISERKRTEQALLQKQEELYQITESIPVVLWTARPDGYVDYVNQAWLDHCGVTLEEAQGSGWLAAVHPDDVATTSASWTKACQVGGPYEVEHRLRRREGGYTRFLSRAVLTRDRDGGPLKWYGANVDITARVEAEQARIELERQLHHAQRLESLGVLAGGIAHDFNNLLQVIVANASLAKQLKDGHASALEFLDNIEAASKRAAALTKQMLAYAGKGRVCVELVEPSRLCEQIGTLLESSISRKARLHRHIASALPCIQADPGQMSQLIMNLVINASEALEDREGDIWIRTDFVAINRQEAQHFQLGSPISPGPYVRLEITDTGCGMSDEVQSRLFDPFFSTKFAGRGLGLSAVLGIIRSHKGAIRVTSRPGAGSTFTVLLPIAAESAKPTIDLVPTEPRSCLQGTVLVVDDEDMVRAGLKAQLQGIGLKVLEACDGEEALVVYHSNQQDIALVIMDYKMPKLDGAEALIRLRSLNPGIRAVLSSGYNAQEAIEKYGDLGWSGFVQKPYEFHELEGMIRELLDPAFPRSSTERGLASARGEG